MASISPYQRVKSFRPGRSVFDLSYSKKFTCDMGQLIPVMCDEVVPGDNFRIGNQVTVRFQPLVAPILHEISVMTHYFFLPYRILWDDGPEDSWEAFITGGVDGDLVPVIPRWEPVDTSKGSLWDYLGFPTGVFPAGAYPLDFPRRAYNKIVNEYYRDETLSPEVWEINENIQYRLWEKNYFFSALPWQQRGVAPALPVTITGQSSASWVGTAGDSTTMAETHWDNATQQFHNGSATYSQFIDTLNNNAVAGSGFSASSFDISDLRTAFQVQKFLERNARAGARYVEFLQSHFGVAFDDSRLQRPEYIGGTKAPVIVSEVPQTSGSPGEGTYTPTPQGNLAGHGITVDSNFAGQYTVPEFGLIMGIMSVMPRADFQQGIDRQWLHETKYDFFFPEFQDLSEQAILQAEIFASGVEGDNRRVYGFQGRYDHMRTKHNMVVADMRSNVSPSFDYWHLAIDYATAPLLNHETLECRPSKRIFAVPDEPGLIVNFANVIRAARPLPIQSNPGNVDHY